MRRDWNDDLLRSLHAFNAALSAEVRDVRKLLAARNAEAKANPNWRLQPRAPRGTHEGGQWIDGGAKTPTTPKQRGGVRVPPQDLPRQPHREPRSPRFFDAMDDNPYFWELSEHGLLPSNPTVADFYNLRYDLISQRALDFEQSARRAGMSPAQLLQALDSGSSVMSERAISHVERIFENPGIAGTNIVARDQALRRYVELSGIRAEYRERMFNDITGLAGFTPEQYDQHQRDVGIGLQFPWLLGGGGPSGTPSILPRAQQALRSPGSVWRLGPARRGRVIEAALGHNLPSNFRIIDRFGEDGVATSIKSIDLGAATYLRPQTLTRQLRGYIDQVAGFRRGRFAGREILEQQVRGRALDLAVPHTGTPAQQNVIDETIRYAASRNVNLNIIIYP